LLGLLVSGAADPAGAGCGIRSVMATLAGRGGEDLGLSEPAGLAVDGAGNLYVADAGRNRVRRISRDGAISTVAGRGPAGVLRGGFAGDGGPAVEAELDTPTAVAVGPAGDLFIADSGNHRVRRVAVDGTITTVAGNGTEGFSGDGGPATDAELDFPAGVAVSGAGELYIADTNNHRVRKVTADGIIATVVGSGPAGYLQGALAGDGGPATAARLARPFGLALGPAGDLYIADGFNNRVRRVTASATITTIAGSGPAGFLQGGLAGDGGPATRARLSFPRAVVLDTGGNLHVADALNHRVRRVGSDGRIHTIAGGGATGYLRGSFGGDGAHPGTARLAFPAGLAVGPAGVLHVADAENRRIRAITGCLPARPPR
jgi:sugar lactone lactonase YvrE